MKQYCSKGHSTEFILNKPKFCAECGESFDVLLSSLSNTQSQPVRIKPAIASQEPEENVDEIVEGMNELEVEISKEPRRGISLREAGFSKPSSEKFSRGTKKLTKKQKKEQIEIFKKETAPLGRNSMNIGGEN